MLHWLLRASFVLFSLACGFAAEDEIWEQDLSSDMKIGLSTTGYRSVDLKCGADAFLVNVTLDADFDGVLYTRGDFSSKRAPCFLTSKDVAQTRGTSVLYTLKLPFTQCHTVEDASDQEFVNTLVIQHDSELIMPGDAAFRLTCAFNPEQRLTGSSMLTGPKSRIALVDADPASKKISYEHQAQSDSDSVTFPKKRAATPKEEL